MTELKELRLHGMATAWAELIAQGESATASSKWLLEHLLQQDCTDRAMRSVSHQMNMAKLPMHCDLAGFDFSADARLISELANLSFTDTAQNVVLIGGPGTGKTHLAIETGNGNPPCNTAAWRLRQRSNHGSESVRAARNRRATNRFDHAERVAGCMMACGRSSTTELS